MSKQLLDTLENRVYSAVDTIELLKTEINELREERKILEDKLQELIEKMGTFDNGAANRDMTLSSETPSDLSRNTIDPFIPPTTDRQSDY